MDNLNDDDSDSVRGEFIYPNWYEFIWKDSYNFYWKLKKNFGW